MSYQRESPQTRIQGFQNTAQITKAHLLLSQGTGYSQIEFILNFSRCNTLVLLEILLSLGILLSFCFS